MMRSKTTTKNPLVLGFMAVAMGFQSPTGHDAIYQGLLRSWFALTWAKASLGENRLISFQTLRDNAETLAYDPNPDIFLNNMRLLKGDFSFCLPFVGENEKQPDIPQNLVCHTTTTRDDEKRKKGLAPNIM